MQLLCNCYFYFKLKINILKQYYKNNFNLIFHIMKIIYTFVISNYKTIHGQHSQVWKTHVGNLSKNHFCSRAQQDFPPCCHLRSNEP